MASKAPLFLLAGAGALVLMSKKKSSSSTKPSEKESGTMPGPTPLPQPIPGDQVQPGEILLDSATLTKNYGSIGWRVRQYAGGPQFYVEIFDPDDGVYETATTNRMEDGPVRLFNSVQAAEDWVIAFIKSVDANQPLPPEPEPAPAPDEERGEALGIKPGSYSNFHVNARYGLVSPYRTKNTTVSIRRKSGMVFYPAKGDEARFVGWNPQNPEELLIDIDAKGEYSIMTHDGGPKGVFIAEWVLRVTED